MILYSLEAAQDLMVAVRDLRRTVRLVQCGCVTFFPEESTWICKLIYNTLEADLQQVELDGPAHHTASFDSTSSIVRGT